MTKCPLIAVLPLGLAITACALAACTMSSLSPPSSASSAQSLLGMSDAAPIDSSVGQRELTSPEKKVISDAVALSIKDPASATYRWPKIANLTEGSANYCGTVNAKSPYPAYNGLQAYIVETKITDGKVSSAVVGLIAGGKDLAIVTKMCKKYGLDPNEAI